MNIAVLASGRGSNMEALAGAVRRGEIPARLVLVISDNPEAPVLSRARELGIPALGIARDRYSCRKDFEEALVGELKKADTDLLVLAGYMRLAGPVLLSAYGGRTVNIHPSLLPSFPGLDAQKQALEYGVKISGCTVHFVDDGMDTGPVIAQAAVPVLSGDTPESLAERILTQEHLLLPRVVGWLARGQVKRRDRQVWIEEEKK